MNCGCLSRCPSTCCLQKKQICFACCSQSTRLSTHAWSSNAMNCSCPRRCSSTCCLQHKEICFACFSQSTRLSTHAWSGALLQRTATVLVNASALAACKYACVKCLHRTNRNHITMLKPNTSAAAFTTMPPQVGDLLDWRRSSCFGLSPIIHPSMLLNYCKNDRRALDSLPFLLRQV